MTDPSEPEAVRPATPEVAGARLETWCPPRPDGGPRAHRACTAAYRLRRAFACGLLLVTVPGAGRALSGQEARIERVAWLAGCWLAAHPGGAVEEQWMRPRAGTMVGMSRTVRGDGLVGHELVLLRAHDADLVYEAHPSGQSSTPFHSTTVNDTMAVFENPGHDFPRLVGYRRASGDSLLAWIVGPMNGQERRIEFRYRRVACPGP